MNPEEQASDNIKHALLLLASNPYVALEAEEIDRYKGRAELKSSVGGFKHANQTGVIDDVTSMRDTDTELGKPSDILSIAVSQLRWKWLQSTSDLYTITDVDPPVMIVPGAEIPADDKDDADPDSAGDDSDNDITRRYRNFARTARSTVKQPRPFASDKDPEGRTTRRKSRNASKPSRTKRSKPSKPTEDKTEDNTEDNGPDEGDGDESDGDDNDAGDDGAPSDDGHMSFSEDSEGEPITGDVDGGCGGGDAADERKLRVVVERNLSLDPGSLTESFDEAGAKNEDPDACGDNDNDGNDEQDAYNDEARSDEEGCEALEETDELAADEQVLKRLGLTQSEVLFPNPEWTIQDKDSHDRIGTIYKFPHGRYKCICDKTHNDKYEKRCELWLADPINDHNEANIKIDMIQWLHGCPAGRSNRTTHIQQMDNLKAKWRRRSRHCHIDLFDCVLSPGILCFCVGGSVVVRHDTRNRRSAIYCVRNPLSCAPGPPSREKVRMVRIRAPPRLRNEFISGHIIVDTANADACSPYALQ